jgi:hypothetical protein
LVSTTPAASLYYVGYGLRPRHAANTLAIIVCSDAGFRME